MDFDGTLSVYVGSFITLGPPIPLMITRVKDWLAKGYEVRIFTARAAHKDEGKRSAVIQAIQDWCVTHIGEALEVTNEKGFDVTAIYDDKAFQVRKNTGLILTKHGWK